MAMKSEQVSDNVEIGQVGNDGDIKNLMDDLYDLLQGEIDEEIQLNSIEEDEEPVEEDEEINSGSQKLVMMKPQKVKKKLRRKFSKKKMYLEEAELKMSSGDLKGAEKYLRKAFTMDPENYLINYNLGNTLQELGKLNESQLFYDKAITIEESKYEPWLQLGIILMERDPPDLHEAMVFLKHAQELSDDDSEIDQQIEICKEMIEQNN